ncbi:EscC/YscC/HrcC family type III secretion system outer membrane ring protein [Paraburkholderia dinghuensis]|uniref:Type 3 secretion system secretin n=2 Tax=Paraburkholderia dinghuensis TaxID=2305225 RepID=A0A3N6MYH9_9BURK|nr:EscC/YscC/HrcC family type III secretion system outer membrane ring protein [Paraburkholderia dinghuensis]
MFMTRRSERAKVEKICVRRYRAAVGIRRVVVAGIVLNASMGNAVQPVWRAETMHYFARDTPLPDVLREVVSAGGLQVKISPGVKEPVNGEFNELPERVFARLIEAYGLSWYFDGHVIHVSRTSDIRNRTIPFAPMTRSDVVSLLSNLGLDDSHLPVRYSETTAVVTGPSGYVDAIADAVAQAQAQIVVSPVVSEMAIRVFPLRYAQAQDITYNSGNRQQIVPGVASLLRKLMADVPVSVPSPETSMKVRSQRREDRGGMLPLPSLRGLGLADSAPVIDTPLPDAGVINTVAASMRRNIVADARTNSVVIYDVPSMMPNYERTIALLDKPQDLVEITAAVIDVSTDAATELGIHLSGTASGGWGAATAITGALSSAQNAATSAILSGANLATMIGSPTAFLFAKIRALEESGKARVLSRPQVLTLNNTEAVLSSRNSIYVRVAGNQDVDLYNVDTGLTLKVTPTVESVPGDVRNILLSVQIEDGAFDSSDSVDGIPKVSHNSIVTQAVIKDGESLLVGGYVYERNANSSSGVPVLSDLPFIGYLFSDKEEQAQRRERLILITPRIKSMTTPAARTAVGVEPLPSGVTPSIPQSGIDGTTVPTPMIQSARYALGSTDLLPPLPTGSLPGSSTTKDRIR